MHLFDDEYELSRVILSEEEHSALLIRDFLIWGEHFDYVIGDVRHCLNPTGLIKTSVDPNTNPRRTRLRKALLRDYGIIDIRAICAFTVPEILDMRQIGVGCLYEIRDMLAELGLYHSGIDEWIQREELLGKADPRVNAESGR